MAITDRTRKILWARSGNRCAFCRTHLIESQSSTDPDAVVGDECHIMARSPDGPRGGGLPQEVLDEIDNLILLCKTHHKLVDDQPVEYSVEKLREIRRAHETWVETTLGIAVTPVASDSEVIFAVEQRLARIEFLQEWSFPLRYILLAIDLRSPLTPEQFGHFRALLTLFRSGAGQFDTLCVGGRDAYITYHADGVNQLIFGTRQLAWLPSSERVLQQMALSHGYREVPQIVFEVSLRDSPAFTTMPEIEQSHAQVYLTEPLWEETARISIVVNDFVLGSFDHTELARLNGDPVVAWPEELSTAESDVSWVPVLPRGRDYDRYQREGDRPDWFPQNLYAQWLMDLATVTPTRIRRHNPAD